MRRLVPDVLRAEPQFRLLFAGQALSAIGDRVMLVALPFAVLAAGGTVTTVGFVAAAELAPFLVLALAGGVVADRADRRRILIASDSVRLAMQALAGTLVVTGAAQPWQLAACAAVFGGADAFFAPAFTGLLPQTLSTPERIQPANALRSLAASVSAVVGPVLAGVLVVGIDPGGALLFDALTFAASVACLLALRPGPASAELAAEAVEGEPAPGGFLADLRGGWRAVRERGWVLAFLGGMVVYHVIVLPAVYVLGPVLARDELGGPGAWAAIVATFGAGSIVGDLLLLRWRPARPLRVAAGALALASCQAAAYGSGLPLGAVCAIQFAAAIGVTACFTLWETTLQEHVPPASLSRVSSYDYMVTVGLMPLGTVIAGPVADAVGLHTTLRAMSVVGVLAACGLLGVRSVRTLGRGQPPAPTPVAPGTA